MKQIILAWICLFLGAQAFAQNRVIEGSIRDAVTTELLPGVTVKVFNSNIGTTSDGTGHYKLNVPPGYFQLKYSFIGYKDTLITLKSGNGPQDILLSPSAQFLQGVVIAGYTSQSREKLTGSISKIKGADVGAAPVASLDQTLQGRVPGVYVASASGLPGTPGRVTIRGIGSLQGGNTNPLYLIDGVPVEPASFAAFNPEDFESYTVLKDAASTAQYGSRAANGVIVITTKKGHKTADGKLMVHYQNQFGFSQVNNSKWNMMNSKQRLQFEEILKDPAFPGWQYSRKNNVNPDGSLKTEADYNFGDHFLDSLRGVDNHLKKYLLRAAFTQSHHLDVSGGTDQTTYYLSGAYFQQNGVLRNSGLDRFSLRSNVEHRSGKLKLGLNIGLGYVRSKITEGDFNVSETNPVAALYFSLPYENLFNPDGTLATGTNKYGANALSMYQDISRQQNQLKSVLSANISYLLAPGLKLMGNAGLDFQQMHNTGYIRPDSYLGSLVDRGAAGSYQNGYVNKLGMIATAGLLYTRSWGKHEIEGNLLTEVNKNTLSSSGFTGYGLIPGIIGTPAGISPGTNENAFIPLLNGQKSQSILLSQIGLFRYSFDHKYTFTASLRRDGSSRVPESNRYRMFYALGGSWNISGEDFMKEGSVFSSLRLRASYGRTGNASGFASDFGYRSLYGAAGYGGKQGLIPVFPGNPAYNWELNDMGNAGLEFGFLKDRIRGSIDVYNRMTSNLFIQKRLSYTSGFESMAANAGKIRNRGIEMFLEGDVVQQNDFKLSLGLNLAYNKNRIMDLGGPDQVVTDDYSINRVGMPLGQFYMVRWAGVNAQTGAPQYLDASGNITSTFNPDDAVPVKGSFDPPLKGGFNISLTYKRFELNTMFTFIKGMYRLNTAELFRTSADPNYRQYNQSVEMLDMWQKPGDISMNPGAAYPRYMTDRELQNADYIKLRNVRLAYRVPGFKKMGKSTTMQMFLQGQNLITWTRFKAFDPEDDNNWYQYEYPLPRTITAGLSLTF